MKFKKTLFLTSAIMLLTLFSANNIFAHCDGVDGPVVTAAKKALETGNVNLVLIWVQKEDENAIKDAFNKTLHVRALSQEARELADFYFFETLVRIHRAGEGEPYTGLKPAGRDLGPVIPVADRAIAEGSIKELKNVFAVKKIKSAELEKTFNLVLSRKNYDANNVQAGRDYVHSYVEFLHKAEHMYTAKDLHETKEEKAGSHENHDKD